jgi:DNA-binding GntR family transcriptional regulator
MPVRERTYQHLKSNILSGHFNPGERLTEEHLARKLGVSRTPVREALHKLESEGLIKSLVTRGFIVSRDSKDEMEELFDIRAILEGYLMRMICETISEGTLRQLDQFVEKAEEALSLKKIEEVFKWNTQFHDALHSLVQNKQRFHQMMVNIRKYVLRYRKDTLRYPDGGKRTIEGHRKIMMSLRLRDPDLCERVMREHIQEAKEDALQTIFEKT